MVTIAVYCDPDCVTAFMMLVLYIHVSSRASVISVGVFFVNPDGLAR